MRGDAELSLLVPTLLTYLLFRTSPLRFVNLIVCFSMVYVQRWHLQIDACDDALRDGCHHVGLLKMSLPSEVPAAKSMRKRPHICPRCQKAFLRAEHLDRHLMTRKNTTSPWLIALSKLTKSR